LRVRPTGVIFKGNKSEDKMKVNPAIFRMYDIRGVVGSDITPDFAEILGLAYGTYLREKGGQRVSVGRDVRPSSLDLKDALIEGLRRTGIHVTDIGIVPTPLLYFSLHNLPVDGGIEVTASHNPKEYNGFKINLGKETLYGEEIQKLREIMEGGNFPKTFERGKYEKRDVLDSYINFMLNDIKIEGDIKVMVDAGNGCAGPVIKELFPALGIKFDGLYLEPDGNFPHHLPDPTVPEYMEKLVETVKGGDYDLGIGYDGDVDRIGAVDEEGNMVFGDKLTGIFAGDVLMNYPSSPIVFDVKCSEGLVEYIRKLGGKPVMWKTGHSLLKAKLKELNAPFAGEMSGHVFFNDRYFGYDDALYASLRLFEIITKRGKKLSELVGEIPFYHSTPEIRVGCPDDRKFDIVKSLVEHFKKNYDVIDIDGARIQFGDGFGLVRASNTQPVLVLRFEAKSVERLEEIKGIVYGALRKYPEVELKEE
jgi:phosphomannomutase/phosphoglucomutase